MKLIAKKPCSFGGQRFYIGDEIPEELVADTRTQEKMRIITVVNDTKMVSDRESGTLFTLEQVEKTVAEAVDEAVNNTILEMEQKQKELQEAVGILQKEEFLSEGTMFISVNGDSDRNNEQKMAVPATTKEIQQVFSIMQMNATDGIAAISGIKSENVLIILHAADSRKTVKNAAKEQRDKLSTKEETNEATCNNTTTDTYTERN